jgi:DNA-binding response OmpR family regulator
MAKDILIIDDDEKLNRLLKDFLARFGYEVKCATHPKKGLDMISADPPDLIILDIMLPDMDGFTVCREIRKSLSIPIIMLTARGEVTDRIVGLELGADDYLPKPFEPRELVARIQSVLRRSVVPEKQVLIKHKDLVIDSASMSATLKGRVLDLTTMEFEALLLFANNPGITLTRDTIIEKLRGFDWDSFDRSIDVLISRLRSKLKDDPQDPAYIKTVWGRGYMFIRDSKK